MVVPAAAVLIVAGFQVPVIPLSEVPGKVPGVAPIQYGPNCAKVGVMLAFTVTDIVAVFAHWPVVGVNVYVVVPAEAVLMVAGLHVPVIPLVEVPGNVPGTAPTQYGPNTLNVGVTIAFIVTVFVAVLTQPLTVTE